MDNEFTANVALPDVAIKLRELRLTQGLSLVAVAIYAHGKWEKQRPQKMCWNDL